MGGAMIPSQTGRALIGWMTANEATLWLSGRRADLQNNEEYARRAEQARQAVAARPTGIDQTDITGAPPDELRPHIEALRQNPASAHYLNEGWQVAVVDLARVCAAQPHIVTGQSTQRVQGVRAGGLASLATVSLPIVAPTTRNGVFDPFKNAWIFSASNPNLRIGGCFNGEVQPGVTGFGFIVGVAASFMQVAQFRDRYLLRDGYHRAFGFLRTGVKHVPVFFRQFATYEELGLPVGMLPQDSFLGERPASLRDYLDDAVSAEIQIPITQKMVVVQALEFSSLS